MITKKTLLAIVAALVLSVSSTHAEIIETKTVKAIFQYLDDDTLLLFNIAEVLTDSTISLGSSPSRKYIKAKAQNWDNKPECDVHDAITWLIANSVPHKAIEPATPEIIKNLQDRGIAIAALTSRGRSEWYTTQVPGVDDVTEAMLNAINIDLTRSTPPIVSIQMEGSPYLDHYRNGIYYSNHMDKGEFLHELLMNSGYSPKNVILIDDKKESLEDVERAMQELGIPFTGFWYTRTKADHADFNPMVATLQLERLVSDGSILSEEEAVELATTVYQDVDPDAYFIGVLELMDFSTFPPRPKNN